MVKIEKSEQALDVEVDRSAAIYYPDWVAEVLHREFEAMGPTHYKLKALAECLHPKQRQGRVKRRTISASLRESGLLENCLAISDLVAIHNLGDDAFFSHFEDKTVYGWRSVVLHHTGTRHVPCLYEDDGELSIEWVNLDGELSLEAPIFCFNKE